jgi:hypothetical protein
MTYGTKFGFVNFEHAHCLPSYEVPKKVHLPSPISSINDAKQFFVTLTNSEKQTYDLRDTIFDLKNVTNLYIPRDHEYGEIAPMGGYKRNGVFCSQYNFLWFFVTYGTLFEVFFQKPYLKSAYL